MNEPDERNPLLDGVIAKVLVECGAAPADFEWDGDVVTLHLPRGDAVVRFRQRECEDLEHCREKLLKKARKKRVPW